MNFLDGRVTARNGDVCVIALDNAEGQTLEARLSGGGPGEGTELVVGVRPEHLHVDSDGVKVTVEMAEELGGVSYLHTRTGDGTEVVVERRGGMRENLNDQTVGLRADPKDVLVFDKEGQRLR